MTDARRPRRERPESEVLALRDLFWQGVVQEWLTALSGVDEAAPEMLDGRVALLTHAGERIPVKSIEPLFACSIGGTATERYVSQAVQSTVFRVHTPGGEVFTLPLREIRGIHMLTEELATEMEKAAKQLEEAAGSAGAPFGFAAFTSLAKQASAEQKAGEGPEGRG